MRKMLLTLMAGLIISTSFGCALPIYNGEPVRRTRQLIFVSENLRLMQDEWERIWFLDMPSHATPFRTHGGVI